MSVNLYQWTDFLRSENWRQETIVQDGPRPIGEFVDQITRPQTIHFVREGGHRLSLTTNAMLCVIEVKDQTGKTWTLPEAKAATLRRRTDWSESRIVEWLHEELTPHFHLHPEVYGTAPNGKRKKIDLIITPVDSAKWADPEVALGVEVKRLKRDSTGDYCRHFGQSADYAYTDFDRFGFVHVFAYPDCVPVNILEHSYSSMLIPRLLGRVGVGSIHERQRDGLVFVLNGHDIWSQRRGVIEKTWKLKRKFGSR